MMMMMMMTMNLMDNVRPLTVRVTRYYTPQSLAHHAMGLVH